MKIIKNIQLHSITDASQLFGPIGEKTGVYKSKFKNKYYFILIPNIIDLSKPIHLKEVFSSDFRTRGIKFKNKVFKLCDIIEKDKKNSVYPDNCGTENNPYFGYYCVVKEEDTLEFLLAEN